MAGGLNDKQRRFVEEYLIDLNATQAAIRAGYSAKTAYSQGQRLLKHVEIQQAITEGQAQRSERVKIDQDYVLSSIVETIERCKQAKPVLARNGEPIMIENGEGQLVPAYIFNAGAILKGAEMLGNHLNLWKGQQGPDDEDAASLTFHIDVRGAVGNVRVTKPERPAGDIPEGVEHQV